MARLVNRLLWLTPWLLVAALPGGAAAQQKEKFDLDKYSKLPAAAEKALKAAEKFELYSLHPEVPKEKPKDEFHGYKVLGKVALKDNKQKQQVLRALKKGVEDSSGVAGCFRPRHGLRVTYKGGTVDFVICFECMNIRIFAGKEAAVVWTTAEPTDLFNGILKKAGVPLPPGPNAQNPPD
jgi:hypothetical protein